MVNSPVRSRLPPLNDKTNIVFIYVLLYLSMQKSQMCQDLIILHSVYGKYLLMQADATIQGKTSKQVSTDSR